VNEALRDAIRALRDTGFATEPIERALRDLDGQSEEETTRLAGGWASRHPDEALELAEVLLRGVKGALDVGDPRWHGAAHACEHVDFALQHLQTDDRQEEHTGE
jgi:DNA-binding transcriptional MerR regulator